MGDIDKKIKLCFVIAMAYPLFKNLSNATIGGAEINLYNLALGFSKDTDFEVSFLVGDYGQPKSETYGNIKVRKIKYLNYDPDYSRFDKLSFKILRELFLIKELLLSDSEVFINSCGGSLLGHIALFCRKIKRKKVIFRLASDADTDPGMFKAIGEALAGTIYNYGLRNTGCIISQTEDQKKLLQLRMGLDSKVIENGFQLPKRAIFSQKEYILWVSRAVDMKRPEVFLELAKRLPSEKFIIIIPGRNEVSSKIQTEASKFQNVTFIDSVSFFEIQDYYDKAKLFVNTSEYEGFPNSFIQACIGGTPILSFRVNPDDFINKHGLGFVCSDDIDKAVGFIRSLDREQLELFGQNALKYVANKHDINNSVAKYKRIILELVWKSVIGKL